VKRRCTRWIADPTWRYDVVTENDPDNLHIFWGVGTKIPAFTNDFAVCYLDTPVNQNDVLPISLNSDPYMPPASSETQVTVIGLGSTSSNGGSLPSTLLEVTNPVIDNVDCQQRFATTNTTITERNRIYESDLCSGSFQKDACFGDSGGPLILKPTPTQGNTHAGHLLVGIVSWGRSCGSEQYPTVYSRISARYDWIELMIQNRNGGDDRPSDLPSVPPSTLPSDLPSDVPSVLPSAQPSTLPSALPSALRSANPSYAPSTIISTVPSINTIAKQKKGSKKSKK